MKFILLLIFSIDILLALGIMFLAETLPTSTPVNSDNEVWIKLVDGIPAIISAVGTLITAIGVIIVGRWAYKSKTQTEANAVVLERVNKNVDGMSSDLVAATSAAKLAEGQLKERDAERAHLSDSPPAPTKVVNGVEDDPLKVTLVKKKGDDAPDS